MKLRFSKSISTIVWTLAMTAGVAFGNSAWAEPLPHDASVPVLITNETIANQPIEFRTLVPDRPITLPKEGKYKAIEKFGIRITNHAKTEKVLAPNYIKPRLLDENGRLMLFSACDNTVTKMIGQRSFRSLKPGESVEFLYSAVFRWDGSDLMFTYETAEGGACSIGRINAGKYTLSIDYVGPDTALLNELSLWRAWNINPKNVWQEEVSSMPATLTLVESQN